MNNEIDRERLFEKRRAFAEQYGYWPGDMTESQMDNYTEEDDNEHFFAVRSMGLNG